MVGAEYPRDTAEEEEARGSGARSRGAAASLSGITDNGIYVYISVHMKLWVQTILHAVRSVKKNTCGLSERTVNKTKTTCGQGNAS